MPKHVPGFQCPGCEDKLTTCCEAINDWFHRIKKIWPEAHVAVGYRDKEDQEKAFKEGKSKLHWPDSRHNATTSAGKPDSHAVDLFFLENGKAVWPIARYHELAAEICSAEVFWGGKFKELGDFDHFEVDYDSEKTVA